jgi:Ca2+-transporting ATPase
MDMWHVKSVEEILKELKTDPARGLPEAEAVRRLEIYGPNRLPAGKKKSLARLFFEQINTR